MQEDIENTQEYQDCLRRSKLILEHQRNGLWWQIHGTVPPKDFPKYEPTAEDWARLKKKIERLKQE